MKKWYRVFGFVCVVAMVSLLLLANPFFSEAASFTGDSRGITSTPGGAQGWSDPEVVSGGQTGVSQSSIVGDSSGAAHMVYANSPFADIKYVTNESGSWSSPEPARIASGSLWACSRRS